MKKEKNQPISKRSIQEIKNKVDIVEIISKYIPLNEYNKAKCPFHNDSKPSFSVNKEGQFFYCFGCGVGGDVIKFLELINKVPFIEALKEVAKFAKENIPEISLKDKEKIEEERKIEEILTTTAEFYRKSLTPEVRKYLIEERGFNVGLIERFRIGYANGSLKNYLINECNYTMVLCLKAGILSKNKNSIKDYFYRRITFPNIRRGIVVHFSARVFNSDGPKYINLPRKIKYLYNEDALLNKEVFVVEGVTDCITMEGKGYPTVALTTSNFKSEFTYKFNKNERVNICLDSDKAGEHGSLQGGNLLHEKVKIIELPEGYDPNEYFKKHTKEEFEILKRQSKGIFKYRIDKIPAKLEKTDLPKEIESIFTNMPVLSEAKIESCLDYIKSKFNLKNQEMNAYRKDLKRLIKAKNNSKDNKEKKNKKQYIALFDELVDLAVQDEKAVFVIKESDKLAIRFEYSKEDLIYVPPPKEKLPWLLPRAKEILKHYDTAIKNTEFYYRTLYDDLITYHKGISELPSNEFYDLLVCWDFHTYLLEQLYYSPIICFFAIPERGKSRTGKGMIYVAYRGIHVETVRPAYLFRVADYYKSSIFIDVMDVWRKSGKSDCEDILLNRYERGGDVFRVDPDKSKFMDLENFDTFGPTLIATNESVHDILQSRSISISMLDTDKIYENDVRREFSLPYRERLEAFRAIQLHKSLPEVKKPCKGRLGDIFKPILQIVKIVSPEKESSILKLVSLIEKEKLLSKAESTDAEIIRVILSLGGEVLHNILPIEKITNGLNSNKPDKFQTSPQRIGRVLSSMGFEKAKTSKGNSAIVWNKKLIAGLKRRYGLGETPVIPETPAINSGDTGVTGDTCVLQESLEDILK